MVKRSGRRRPSDVDADIRNPAGDQLDQALIFVRQRLDQLPSLGDKEPFGDEHTRWSHVTRSGLAQYFGADSEEYRWVYPVVRPRVVLGSAYESRAQQEAREQRQRGEDYRDELVKRRTGLQSILDKYAVLAPPPPAPVAPLDERAARAFISHGGARPSLTMTEEFLRALGVEPVVVEKRASEGREVHENVDVYRKQCDFAIVLWTRDLQDSDGRWLPSGSVAEEAGELRNQFPGRVIYLQEEGVTLPAMASTIQYQRFAEEDMGPAYFKIVTELRGWGFLRVALPGGESAA